MRLQLQQRLAGRRGAPSTSTPDPKPTRAIPRLPVCVPAAPSPIYPPRPVRRAGRTDNLPHTHTHPPLQADSDHLIAKPFFFFFCLHSRPRSRARAAFVATDPASIALGAPPAGGDRAMRARKAKKTTSFWRSLLGGCLGGGGGGRPAGDSQRKVRPGGGGGGGGRLSFTDLSGAADQDLSVSLVGSNLHVFSVAELREATRGFVSGNFLGEGGFGPVYRGFVADGVKKGLRPQAIAVKLWDPEGAQGHKEWLAEVIFLGQLRHPNLVKLVGYCCEDEHRLLVYEYMEHGSLENHLFKQIPAVLPWSTRLNIAVGAAKGLAFLHDAEKPVIYRDFKASNILLDSDYKAKLSDFGLAKDGPEGDDTHVSTRVMGTHGYAAPEYIMTGHLTAKSDVYSFGVVLLEILTGRRSVDKTRPSREQNLVDYARPCLKDPLRLGRIMDPAMEGQYSARAAQSAALVAYRCLSGSPKNRPDMSAVVQALEPLLDLNDDVPAAPVGHVGPVVLFVAAAEEQKKERAPRKDVHVHRRRPMSPKASPRKRPGAGTKEEFWVWHLPTEQKA